MYVARGDVVAGITLARPLLQRESSTGSTFVVGSRRTPQEFGSPTDDLPPSKFRNDGLPEPLDYTMESLLLGRQNNATSSIYDGVASSVEGDMTCSEDEYGGATRSSTKLSVSSEPAPHRNRGMLSLYHGTWPVEKTMWNSEPTRLGSNDTHPDKNNHMEVTSVMSFASSSGGVPLDRVLGSPDPSKWSSQQLEAKMDVVHSLLAMLGGQEHVDMGETLLALSSCPESCLAMRQSGCIPLLVKLVQSDRDGDTRRKAAQALHNLVNSQTDEKLRKRESRVLKLTEQCRAYTEALRNNTEYEQVESSSSVSEVSDGDKHPVQTVAHLMKLSFDEGHRQAICQLGGIYTIASLVEVEHTMHSSTSAESHCILMRRYACMALTNLTFGDSGNKALLCSIREFMRALVVQLQSPSDELRQVTASVLRNLSWRADSTSKEILREVGSVTGLMKAAILDNKENTLKSILSALWNLSAHCTENKAEICAVENALGFLVDMLTYKTPTKSMAIIENAGGILRNISSQIAVREDYREVLRQHNCLQILLEQLKSPSLTIVSNACGTLWNLSAKCAADQEILWELGAPSMLRSLNHSKHKMIAMGSSAALKNLLSSRPQQVIQPQLDSTALSLDLPVLPTLGARKQKALMQDLDQNLSETYENIEKDSPIRKCDKDGTMIDFTQDSRRKSKMKATSPDFEEEIHLSNNFANLNLNEPSTSYTSDSRLNSRIPQSYGSSSLPYVNPSSKQPNSCTYIPVRNKYSDCAYEDEIDVNDQPIDYSKKYSETKVPNSETNIVSSTKEHEYPYSKQQTEKESFGMYAETDLDQPTDYSLRYAEDDSDSEISKSEPQEYVQDTIKTYCTEDTPYETPFNFSTATSMSDLRLDEKPVIDNDKPKVCRPKLKKEVNESVEEKDRCSVEDISELDTRAKLSDKIPKSELSSGLLSPEKPIYYAEEGTPGYFSRVSSFGSLNSIPANESLKDPKGNEILPSEPNSVPELKPIEKMSPKTPAETKAVKFERVVNYAEETPLMFSRSSSLASLDSIEQHSIHDDRSSVVSDFSRLPSGIVSPSELPDSPTQTVPPSPKPRQKSLDFPSTSKPLERRPQPAVRTIPKPSIFEDNITKFKEESTPIQFSTTTSLSSLTIDDPEETKDQENRGKQNEVIHEEDELRNDEDMEKKDAEKETVASDINDEFVGESEDDGDEDILADCISIGMQTNRHTSSNPTLSSDSPKLPLPGFKYAATPNSGIPLSRNGPRSVPHPKVRPGNGQAELSLDQSDTLRAYFTEDTPARLSHAGSNSDLSLLSELNESKGGSRRGDYFSDDSSNLSGDNDNILAECIRSAMPKAIKEPAKDAAKPAPSCLPRRNVQTAPMTKYNTPCNSRRSEATKGADINRRDNSLPPYLNLGDEVASYAVENSPCQFSLRSSLSDLTVDGSVAGLKRSGPCNQTEDSSNKVAPNPERTVSNQEQNTSRQERSRRESLSSISVESLGSLEAEQALLEQCISSGMPKSTSESETKLADSNVTKARSIPKKAMGKSQSRDRHRQVERPEAVQQPKNVSAASVAGSTTIQANQVCPPSMSTAVAGVGENQEARGTTKKAESRGRVPEERGRTETRTGNLLGETAADSSITGTSPDRCSPIGEISYTDLTKSGSRKSITEILNTTYESLVMEDCLARSCDESKTVDNRMLDPDAMIESLDRFTAELVSQASHLTKDDDKYNKSSTGNNTWNDDTSPNDVTFPSISGSAPNVITFSNEEEPLNDWNEVVETDVPDGVNEPSADFMSINTSTMTDSTLIAIEASKMVTAFKNEAEMSLSITSAASLELDHVQPPSQMNSLSNSFIGLEKIVPRSPKLMARKKSLPAGLMVRRALSNSLQHGSSLESLENNSLSNLDQVNPPFDLLNDLEGSMRSVASLPSEMDRKADFVINGILNKESQNFQHPIFNVKQPFSELENINPPSLFNEITDFCNSLADVPTEALRSETDIFEDCYTHLADSTAQDITLMEDDLSQFADAKSDTPLQSDLSSTETTTPKKSKSLTKSMTTKQRRNLARDRYKTYTVAAEMVMREEAKLRESGDTMEEFGSTQGFTVSQSVGDMANESPTCSIEGAKLTPREKRQMNRSRFETQVVDEAITKILHQPVIEPPVDTNSQSSNSNSCTSSPAPSPARTKLSIRRNFMQKRLENKDRFRTQTLSESSFSPELSSGSPPLSNGGTEMELHLQKEANRVLKTIRDTKTMYEDLIDCETLSLVSNDDESELNSGGSVNYRTYHKSWGFKKNNIPDIGNEPESIPDQNLQDEDSEDQNKPHINGKPKIVKPGEGRAEESHVEEEVKGIRGRRKPLYSKSNINNKIAPKSIKPVKTMTSNLVKNVTSTIKNGTDLKSVVSKQNKNFSSRPALVQAKVAGGGYRSRPNSISPKTSPARVPANKSSPKHVSKIGKPGTPAKGAPPVLERQGTFTKDDPSPSTATTTPASPKPSSRIPAPSATRIPTFASKIARTIAPPASKIPSNNANKPPMPRNGFIKSASSDRANKNMRVYNRSTSADSREPVSRIQASLSVQSLKGEGKVQNGALKKSSIPSLAPRSSSNTSLNSNGSSGAKKQVTSKIASLWKKIEDSKKQPPKKDTRVWIQADPEPEPPPRLIRSNTFDNKDAIVLRNQPSEEDCTTKRISRLGSFVVMDENGIEVGLPHVSNVI
ncbi:hypothetical protein JTB14_011993 [Gonioctena quinquepunctata]|nr:hypothetical protein JTB14_011993 [Gonioctena quinquepunctata]